MSSESEKKHGVYDDIVSTGTNPEAYPTNKFFVISTNAGCLGQIVPIAERLLCGKWLIIKFIKI